MRAISWSAHIFLEGHLSSLCLNYGMTSLVSNPVRCWGPDHGVKRPAKMVGIIEPSLQKLANKAELLLTCSKGFVAQVGFVSPGN